MITVKAPEGMYLCNRAGKVIGQIAYLCKNDSPDNYEFITAEEKEQLEKEWATPMQAEPLPTYEEMQKQVLTLEAENRKLKNQLQSGGSVKPDIPFDPAPKPGGGFKPKPGGGLTIG